jgi:drug/metabolite transporter (DMT)-like permease
VNEQPAFVMIFIFGAIISAFAQILLKKSSGEKHKSVFREYINAKVICAYFIFLAATFCTIVSLSKIPLSWTGVLGASEYIFIIITSRIFLKEKPSRKKLLGLVTIIIGIIVFMQ